MLNAVLIITDVLLIALAKSFGVAQTVWSMAKEFTNIHQQFLSQKLFPYIYRSLEIQQFDLQIVEDYLPNIIMNGDGTMTPEYKKGQDMKLYL